MIHMDMRGYQRYREDSLNTMTQGELLLLLYDELIKRLTQAELSLGQENYEGFEGGRPQCRYHPLSGRHP